MSDWKQAHANQAEEFAQHELIEDVLTEFAGNMNFGREGLPEYGLKKIVCTTAQVVLARALGFEPDMLRISRQEFNEHQLRLARLFEEAGKPVFVVISQKDKAQ